MVNLKFLRKMQVSSDKQIPGLVKSNGNGDFIDGCQEKRTKDGLLTRRRHSENIIYDCQNNVRKYNSEIKDMKMCIELSQQLTQNTVDNRSVVSALVTTTNPKDDVQVKYKTRIDSASKYTLKRSKNIKHEVCTKCKEILKYIDRFLNNNNDKIMISPRQKLPESVHDISKLNNRSNKLDILNEQKKTCVDAKQNVQTNIGCQNTLRQDKSGCEIVLNSNKSTSKENSTNKKNFDKNKIEQSVSSYKTSDKDNSTVVCNKPVSSKFNSDAMCYFVDLDTCPSYVCPDKCGPPKSPKHFCFRKKVDVGIDTDCCFKRSLFNRIGNFFSCINAKFRCRQNNQNVECGKPLKDARNQTKKLTINIKKEPVCIIFENASGCNDKSPNIFGKFPKKKVAFRDECVNLPKGLVAIKIDPNNKRVINKRELKSILKSLPKREIKNCPIPASTSKVEVQTILKQRSSPIATACKGPMFVLKIDRNNMRILNYPEVKCKISNLNKMCAKNANCESWVVTKGKCNKKQKVRSVESKMSLWDRYHRSKSKSPSAPVKKKHSEGKIDKKPSQKSTSDFKLFSKVNRCVKKKQKSKSGSIVTKHVRGKTNKKINKKVARKKKIVKKRCKPPKKPKCPKRKSKQKTVLHKKGKSAKSLKKNKLSKRKNKKKKGKTRRKIKKSKSVFKRCCVLFKAEIKNKRKKKKSSKPNKKKSKSKLVICKNKDKPHCRESNLEKCQYDYLRHTKTPCLWLFVACPFLHRNYMMFRSIFHDFTRCMLLMLALVFWCPCFLCIELFRCFCS